MRPEQLPSMTNIAETPVPIYRVYPLHRIRQLLVENKNALVRPEKWEDPFENFMMQNTVRIDSRTVASMEKLRKSWYGQCWTLNEESDAMWRIYSPDKTGVKIRTTTDKLYKSFYDASNTYADLQYFIGKVEYRSANDIHDYLNNMTFHALTVGGDLQEMANTLLVKRDAFSHENEVRLLFKDADELNSNSPDIRLFDFPWHSLVDEVVFDPRIDINTYEILRAGLISIGCTQPIQRSSLYEFQPIVMPSE